MNKKKLLAALLAVVTCALSCCALIDNPGKTDKGGTNGLKITDDFMVGMLLYVDKYDSVVGNYVPYPTNKLDDENAISLYHATRNYQDASSTYGELISNAYLSGVSWGIGNAGTSVSETNPYGKIEIGTTFVYTYELLGSVLLVNNIYQKNGKDEYYVQDESGSGYILNNFGSLSLSSEQNISTPFTNIDGTVKELKYDGKWTVNVKFTDYLISAKVIEFDENYHITKTQNIDIAGGEFLEYKAQPNCEFLFVEEEYEVKHSNENYQYPIGTKYTERYFFNKSAEIQNHAFHVPVGNGFVKYIGLKIEFSNEL